MNLKEDGFRFIVEKGKDFAMWRHPSEMGGLEGWTDVTDMSDDEFDDFMMDS